jgi:hypothetical protein
VKNHRVGLVGPVIIHHKRRWRCTFSWREMKLKGWRILFAPFLPASRDVCCWCIFSDTLIYIGDVAAAVFMVISSRWPSFISTFAPSERWSADCSARGSDFFSRPLAIIMIRDCSIPIRENIQRRLFFSLLNDQF